MEAINEKDSYCKRRADTYRRLWWFVAICSTNRPIHNSNARSH